VNDNQPVCQRVPVVQLNKEADLNTVVATVMATDRDIGVNSEITFTNIRGPYSPQLLAVDPTSGVLELKT